MDAIYAALRLRRTALLFTYSDVAKTNLSCSLGGIVLEVAAALCFLIGVIHSYLGERFILIRLLRGDRVPHLFGSGYFTKRTLRFAWHITTFAWWGFGYLLFKISVGDENLTQSVLFTISAVFLLSGLFSFGFTKGKHLSWVVFWSIAGLSYYAAIYS